MRTVIAFSFCLVMALAVMTQAISDPEPLRVETNQLQADTGIFETSEDVAELRKREDQNPDGRRGKLETEEGDKKKKSKRPRKPESVNKKKNKKPRKLKTKKNNDNGKGTRKLKTKKNNGKGPRKLKNNGKGPRKLQKKGQKTRTMNKKPKTNKKPSELSGRPRKTKKLEGTHKLPEILKFPKRKNRKNLKGGMVRGDTNNKRECKPKRKCNALSGECRQKTEGCLNGEVEATGRGKFCSKSTCVCCYAGDDSCANTKKCDKKGGTCQTSDAGCAKFKTGAKWCSGSGCGCCFGGTTTCKAKKKCTKKGGVCQSSSATCKGSIFTKGFCKGGSDCVCCVKEDTTSCIATREYCSDCGIAPVNVADFRSNDDRIVNGADASPDEYPYQVLVETDFPNGDGIFCGGSIIKRKWILTAAHCFFNDDNVRASAARVKVGSILRNSLRFVNVARFIPHQSYVDVEQGNDIALIELTDELDYENDPTIQPICLALESDIPYNGNSVATGWGDLEYNDPNPSPEILQEVALDVITTERCKELADDPPSFTLPTDLRQIVCTLTPSKDSCSGDSGGPLVTRLCNGRWAVFGIVSYGVRCAEPDFPGVYTRVPTYAEWITTTTGSADC